MELYAATLQKLRTVKAVDLPHARRLLKAAALTYLAASLASLLNIARWWALLVISFMARLTEASISIAGY